jgi:2-dehydro-3-deoxyglucarate aldolase/4-hydroxy-2-oxoheptanedioate aldolase
MSATTPLERGALRRRLANGATTVGTFVGMASTTGTEVCAAAGADWLLIDLEHGAGSEDVISDSVLAAASYGVPAIVRVESNERIRIGRVLDQGAAGLTHLRYPPHGDRGVATYNRSCRWGLDRSPLTDPTQNTLGVIQIETLAALDAVEEIAAQDGVDVLFVGPLDLSFALGVPLQFDGPEFVAATGRVLDAAAAHGKTAGILAASAAVAVRYVERGFRFVAIGSDSTMLAAALSDAFAAIRNAQT